MLARSHSWEVLLYFNDVYVPLQESMRGEFRLLPSGSGPAKWVEFSLLSHWGFAANEAGSSQEKKPLCSEACRLWGSGSQGVGGGCEIVACETRHKILSVWGGICMSLSVSPCPCVNVLPFFFCAFF